MGRATTSGWAASGAAATVIAGGSRRGFWPKAVSMSLKQCLDRAARSSQGPTATRVDCPSAHPFRNDGAVRRILERNAAELRSEEHTSELQSLMRISYAVFCLKKKTHTAQQMMTVHMRTLLI